MRRANNEPWTKEAVAESIRRFVVVRRRVPNSTDFRHGIENLPAILTVERFFPSWQCALRYLGYTPSETAHGMSPNSRRSMATLFKRRPLSHET